MIPTTRLLNFLYRPRYAPAPMAAAIAAPATMLCAIQNLLDEDSEEEEHIDIFVYGCRDCSSLALVDLISNHYIFLPGRINFSF